MWLLTANAASCGMSLSQGVAHDPLTGVPDPFLQALGRSYVSYREKLLEKNKIDFSFQQKLVHDFLLDPEMLKAVTNRWDDCFECEPTVHQHLHGTLSLTHGPHRLGRFSAHSVAITATPNRRPRLRKRRSVEKSKNRLFRLAWKSRKERAIPTLPQLQRLLAKLQSRTFHLL